MLDIYATSLEGLEFKSRHCSYTASPKRA